MKSYSLESIMNVHYQQISQDMAYHEPVELIYHCIQEEGFLIVKEICEGVFGYMCASHSLGGLRSSGLVSKNTLTSSHWEM